MEYVVILKKEVNWILTKYNQIKKWFFDSLPNQKIYFYEDDIDLNRIKSNFYLFSSNVFPLMCSLPMEKILDYPSSYVIEKNSHQITFVGDNEKSNFRLRNSYDNIRPIINNIKLKDSTLINEFLGTNYLSKKWFFVNDDKILNFLKYLDHFYFNWSILNTIKLKLAFNFPMIIFYDGKNKLESKKLVDKIGVNVTKTLYVFENESEIEQKILDNYSSFVVKPTNLDGGRLVFKQTADKKLDASFLKKKFSKFHKISMDKEINPLIYQFYKPKIIIEEYIKDFDDEYTNPWELKFYVFNGIIVFFIVLNNNKKGFDFFDANFNKIPNSKMSYERTSINFEKIELPYFDRLKEDVLKIYNKFEKDLEKSFISRFLRIDFFVTKDDYFFSEFSLFPNGGEGRNLNNFGKKFFTYCWVPEIFTILNNFPIVNNLTVPNFENDIFENFDKFKEIIKDEKELINYLFEKS